LKLIKNLGSKINSTGRKQSCGLFYCTFCNKEVEKQLGNGVRDKSCGCNQYSEEWLQSIKDRRKKQVSPMKGRKHSEITKFKQSEVKKGKFVGKNNPSWQGGKSFESYSSEFNESLKQAILIRDNYKCKNIDCGVKPNLLHIHHIDYVKRNNLDFNLITLCASCHAKTNFNRFYWKNFYQKINKPIFTEFFNKFLKRGGVEVWLF